MYDYGCLYCRTGREGALASKIRENYPHIGVIVAKKMRVRRLGRECIEEAVTLFPGYLFFRIRRAEAANAPVPAGRACPLGSSATTIRQEDRIPEEFRQVFRWQDAYRVLTNADGEWRLAGSDRQMAEMLFDMNGTIGFSRVFFDEGNRVRVLEGFLKDYEGDIIRVDKRHRSAQIRIDFQGRIITEWLGYEVIERPDVPCAAPAAEASGSASPEEGRHS